MESVAHRVAEVVLHEMSSCELCVTLVELEFRGLWLGLLQPLVSIRTLLQIRVLDIQFHARIAHEL